MRSSGRYNDRRDGCSSRASRRLAPSPERKMMMDGVAVSMVLRSTALTCRSRKRLLPCAGLELQLTMTWWD
jgi:hypothetical protein